MRYNKYTCNSNVIQIKSEKNKTKHGIDFIEAQLLWEDPDLIQIPVKTINEPRFLVIGKIGEKNWSGIITYRGEIVRIISVRRSRKEEKVIEKAEHRRV